MGKVRFFGVVIVGLIGLVLTSFLQEKQPIKYMQVATIEPSAADEPSIVVTLKDSVTNETVFLRKTKDNIPLHYFKKVIGEVCDDEECRLLDILVYWNITGRYLGFELPMLGAPRPDQVARVAHLGRGRVRLGHGRQRRRRVGGVAREHPRVGERRAPQQRHHRAPQRQRERAQRARRERRVASAAAAVAARDAAAGAGAGGVALTLALALARP